MYEIIYHSDRDVLNTKGNKRNDILNFISKIKSKEKYYKVIAPIDIDKIIKQCSEHAKIISENYKNIVVVGMGGATLTFESILSVSKNTDNEKNVFILNNTDPEYFNYVMSNLDLEMTAFVIISNSGQTSETISLSLSIIDFLKHNHSINYGKNLFFVTSLNSDLADIAIINNAILIKHDDGINGRYSSFSNANILLALAMNLDVISYLEGANNIINQFIDDYEQSVCVESANYILNLDRKFLVNISYIRSMHGFIEWNSKIMAESLCKSGKGYVPLYGLGSNDQHSMFQLYLEGSEVHNSMFSIFTNEDWNKGDVTNFLKTNKKFYKGNIAKLTNKSLGELSNINASNVINVLSDINAPVRHFKLSNVSEYTIGSLIAHSIIEIMLLAMAISVDPFSQGAVDKLKFGIYNSL